MITDTYPDRFRNQFLVLGLPDGQRRIDLARTHLPMRFKRELQVDLHPRLHPSRPIACADTGHTGTRALMTVDFSRMPAVMKLLLFIVNYRSDAALAQCLASVRLAQLACTAEVALALQVHVQDNSEYDAAGRAQPAVTGRRRGRAGRPACTGPSATTATLAACRWPSNWPVCRTARW